VDLVDDEDLVDLLDDLLLDAIVDDLQVFFLNLEDLLLLVEVVEAVSEVESVPGEAVNHGAGVALTEDVVTAIGVVREGDWSVDGLCG